MACCLPAGLGAQLGLHPPEVDWRRLRTDEGNILYPAGYEARAQRIANLMAVIRDEHAGGVGEKHYRFDLVLQTPNLTVNGYVGLAPFRSEFFLTPPQQPNLLSMTDWADLLTVHEFRHVQQVSNQRRGWTKIGSWLFGQLAWAGMGSLAIPNWYMEGDAVVAETALTPSGRGRTPAFSATLRSILDEGRYYNYSRSRNNSLRRLIPDHYRYGYNTINYARERFGEEVWRGVFQRASAYRGIVYPFTRQLRKATGLGTRKMYRAAIDDLAARQDTFLNDRAPAVAGEPIGADPRAVTDYHYPLLGPDGVLLALRSGYRDVPTLVAIDPDGGPDRKITPVGIQREPYVDARGELATWMETRNHPRYTNQTYSDLIVYNLRTGEKRKLTTRGKLFSPSADPAGERIVAVERDIPADVSRLVVLDVNSGAVLTTIDPVGQDVALPKFSPDGGTVYYYDRGPTGTAIVSYALATNERAVLLAATYEPLGNLHVSAGGKLIYSSGRDGIDNAYQLDPATGEVGRLTDVRIGAEFPIVAADGGLYYTEATPRGKRLRRLSSVIILPSRPAAGNPYERPAAWVGSVQNLLGDVPQETYPSEDVHDNLSGLRLHSWSFAGNNVAPGVSLVASNALNTLQASATALYNRNEERFIYGIAASYGGLYPVLTARAQFANRAYDRVAFDESGLVALRQRLDQLSLGLTAAVPLSWVAGEFSYAVVPSVGYDRIAIGEAGAGAGLPANFSAARGRLGLQAIRRRARSQVHSRLGATANLAYSTTIGRRMLGDYLNLDTRLWLPGLFKTHGTRVDFAYRSRELLDPYQFIDNFQEVRGYSNRFTDRSFRMSFNYELPLLYPDFGLLGIWYLRRVRLNTFYDRGFFTLVSDDRFELSSVGAELFFDQVWLNTASGSFGIQVARILDDVSGESGGFKFGIVVGQRF